MKRRSVWIETPRRFSKTQGRFPGIHSPPFRRHPEAIFPTSGCLLSFYSPFIPFSPYETDRKEAARYNRQILLDEIGEAGQLLLKQARVLIVGVGGLGSPVALYLAGAGVGTIGLIDDDTVSETNLQRQVLYSEPEIGLSKAEQAKLRLQALNSDIRVEAWNERLTPQNAECLIANYDIVVDGCDNFRTRYLINDTCVRLDKVYVYGAIREFDGQVSVFNYQGGPDYRTLFPDEEGMLAMPHPSKAVLGVTPGVVGCVEANETMKVILGSPHALSGRLWHIDLKSMESYVISLV